MKKLLSVLLAVVLLLSVCSVAAFAAESELTVEATSTTTNVKRGDTVEVKLNLTKNAGLANLGLTVGYDADVLEMVCEGHSGTLSCTNKRLPITKVDFGEDYSSDNGQTSKYHTVNPYVIQWSYGLTEEAITYTGNIAIIKFKVKDTAAFGKTTIDVELQNKNCDKFEDIGSLVKFATTEAKDLDLTVVCPHTGAKTQKSDDNQHWNICNDCNQVVGSKENHKGGTATCTAQAECSVCQKAYGDTKAHNYTVAKQSDTHHWTECSVCNKEEPGSKETHNYNKEVVADKYAKDPASCNNNATYYKSCECGHKGTDFFQAPDTATGDHVDDNNKWESNATDHWHTCRDCTTEFDKNGHTASANYAFDNDNHWKPCTVCDYHTSSAEHQYNQKVVDDKYLDSPASCKDDATYFMSCICGAKGTTTFTDEGSATGEHVDKDGGEYKSDGTNHWFECGCGEKFYIVGGSIVEGTQACAGGTANCKDPAKCTICSNNHGLKNPDNHVGGTNIQNAKPAKCWEDGYTGDTHCNSCNVKIKDGDPISKSTVDHTSGEWKTNPENTKHYRNCTVAECGEKLDEKDHEGGTATCKDLKKCTVCSKEYGDVDPDNHKNTELKNAEPATEENPGYTGDLWCNDCVKELEHGEPIDQLVHAPEKVEATPATTEKEGNIEYYYCESCKKAFKDAEGTEEIAIADTVIPKLEPEEEKEPVVSPETGDSTTAIAFIVVACAIAAAALVITRKKVQD